MYLLPNLFPKTLQAGSGALPVFYSVGTGRFFAGGKAAGV